MRQPDDETTRRHPKVGTITIRTWNEPEQESYESVFGSGPGIAPPGPNEEFWHILVKATSARYPSIEGIGSLGMVGTDGSPRSNKYFRDEVKNVEQEAVAHLLQQVMGARTKMTAAKIRTMGRRASGTGGAVPHSLKSLGFRRK